MTKRPNEFSLIADYFAPLTGEGSFGLLDDAATLSPTAGYTLVITQDACAEGVHFFPDDAPDSIAKKALRVNLSDLAAKGATPKCFSLALGLGETWDEEWIKAFAKGLSEDIEKYQIELSGGDTFRTGGGTVISITAIGEMPEGAYVSRLGAGVGDQIFVTGTIGDSALGLQSKLGNLKSDNNNALVDRYLLPEPRTEFAEVIRNFASSSMDVSDGLIGDLTKLANASCVSAQLNLEEVPLSASARAVISVESKWLEIAVTGGDDYEILFTVPQEKLPGFQAQINDRKLQATQIGEIKSGEGVIVFDKNRQRVEFDKTSYDHSGEKN